MENVSSSYIGSHKSNFINKALLFKLVDGEMFKQSIDQKNWKYLSPKEAQVVICEMHANVVVRPPRSRFNISKDTMGKLHVEKYVSAIYFKACHACQNTSIVCHHYNRIKSSYSITINIPKSQLDIPYIWFKGVQPQGKNSTTHTTQNVQLKATIQTGL